MITTEIPFEQRLIKQNIQVTIVERTLIDLAAILPQESPREVIDEAIYRRRVSIPRLKYLIKRMPKQTPRLAILRADLARRNETDRHLMSRFEKEVLTDLGQFGFPEPVG